MKFVRNIPAHLDKHMGNKNLIPLKDAGVRNLGTSWAGSIPARYFKGVSGDADNLVIVQFKE